MTVEEIMTRDVVTVTPETSVAEAARRMVGRGVSGLPVVDAAGKLVGVISEGDLILRQRPRQRGAWWHRFFDDPDRLAREYQKTAGTRVDEVMTRDVVSVSPSVSIEAAAAILDSRGIRRLPVTVQGRLVGVVSRGDLVRALAMAVPADVARSDAELVAEMRRRVAGEPWASPIGLVVEAKEGVIALWGITNSTAERDALVTMARAIEGCRGVDDHLAVRRNMPYAYGT